ncbi:MAG: carboxypeptidase regulatory-like domain-containing protein [Planctomycetes bacterium]|nr:carboxypeptidase regulatory-like domain-containing protein [Planctomycetota bacterium]
MVGPAELSRGSARSLIRWIVAVASIGGILLALVWLLGEHHPSDGAPAAEHSASPEGTGSVERPASATPTADSSPDPPTSPRPPSDGAGPITDIVFTRRELVLEDDSAANLPMWQLGSGKTASLQLEIQDPTHRVTPGKLIFTHGLNRGLEVAIPKDQEILTISGLYPGLSMVEIGHSVSDPRSRDCIRRLVALRPIGAVSRIIRVEDPGIVIGTVISADGKPIAGAKVRLDRQVVTTDADGRYLFSNVLGGESVLVYVLARGFESVRVPMRLVTGRQPAEAPPITLRNASPIRVEFPQVLTIAEAPTFLLIPKNTSQAKLFPFESLPAVKAELRQSSTLFPDCAPEDAFCVLGFSGHGYAEPVLREIAPAATDVGERVSRFDFEWKWPITGTVMSGERPEEGFKVRIEVADYANAVQSWLGGTLPIEHVMLELPPFCVREVRTNAAGVFTVETADMPRTAYLILDLGADAEHPGKRKRVVKELPTVGSADLGIFDLHTYRDPPAGKVMLRFAENPARRIRIIVDGNAQPVRSLGKDTIVPTQELRGGIYNVHISVDGDLKSADERTVTVKGDEVFLDVP